MAARLPRISAAELLVLLNESTSTVSSSARPFVVVDVRDEDHVGGHIRSAINEPSSTFRERLPLLAAQVADAQTVIFHCMKSQQRGPACAALYAQYIQTNGNGTQAVRILNGGFEGFVTSPGARTHIHKYDANVWGVE